MKKGYLFLAFAMLLSTAFGQGISVTFKVNTATHPGGVTDSTYTMTVRGDFNNWSETVEGTLANDGGDYYSVTVALPDTFTTSHTINYKFVSDDGLGGIAWEDAIGGNRTLALTAGGTIDAGMIYWDRTTDLYTATDSIDVWFRVNMGAEVGFDTASAVYVAGEPSPLAWGNTSIELMQEGDTYFYSGLAGFANSIAGDTAQYKFIYDQDGVQWEAVDNRTFTLGADTTLAWKWFNDTPPPDEPVV
ncbi:MAG: hypothetical protein KAU50_10280, partial [Candidatus Marinimicrobia bacterium]|nr:hypothetical protein [Candidatus Neomarinimicrobiota bacterium]